MLRNEIPELVLFFDLEWVPDARAGRLLCDAPEDATELEAMEALWKHCGANEEQPRPFVKYLYSRVVSIAFLSRKPVYRDGERAIEFTLNSLPDLPFADDDVDEAAIINRFLYILGLKRPQLVGFNSAEADMQVLIQRGIVNEVTAPNFARRPVKGFDPDDYFKRWDNEDHLDLLKLFSNGKMTPRLNDIAKLCGFPGKIDVAGDHVWELWLNRDITKIVEYNRLDVLNTYLVWLRTVYFCGKLTEEEYASEQMDFREFLEEEAAKEGGDYIARFLELWEPI
ncbi:MAG: ribonuclease H-like domain-containing protein [Pyrinomonadaceae bacterium]|nr:ribonuclease H-like domain-containing protein [Pyrinomonadaceae bacterium]